MDLEKFKYPIGRYEVEVNFDKTSIKNWIKEIATAIRARWKRRVGQ